MSKKILKFVAFAALATLTFVLYMAWQGSQIFNDPRYLAAEAERLAKREKRYLEMYGPDYKEILARQREEQEYENQQISAVNIQSVADWKRKAGYDGYLLGSIQAKSRVALYMKVGRPFKEEYLSGIHNKFYWQCSNGSIIVLGVYEYGDGRIIAISLDVD
jgi:hypothetical protein